MIYDRIKQLREQKGLTQAALARMLNVTRSSVNAWEMGISVPSTQSLVQLAEILIYLRIICLVSIQLLQFAPMDFRMRT